MCASARRPAARKPSCSRPRPPRCSTDGPTSRRRTSGRWRMPRSGTDWCWATRPPPTRSRATTSSAPSSTPSPTPRRGSAAPHDPRSRRNSPSLRRAIASGMTGRLLEPALLARLERLQLGTRRRLAGQFSAEHRSPRHGTSLDFADYREYTPGDDFRRIDYGAWARLDVLLVKLFEAEDDLTLRLLVDTSRSMDGPKLTQAARIAAALGFVALVRRDAVTLHTFAIERLPARGGDVTVVHVLDREELHPTLAGDLDLVDRETGAVVAVSLAHETVARYEREAQAWADGVAARCARAGAAYARVLSTDDIEPLLLGS